MPSIDLKNPDLYQTDAFHDAFARLRKEAPVYWNPESDGPGFWALTKYDDVMAVSKNPQLFSSARAKGGHRIFDENIGDEALDASMISMDPPEHVHYRRMITPGFTPKRIDTMEARIRARVVDLIERLSRTGGQAEFISAFAAELPIQVLAELFGVPQEDRAKLFEWSNAVVGEDDPELRKDQAYIDASIRDMAGYSLGLWQARMQNPGDDLITMLANYKIDGEPMSMQRYLATFILLVVAGNETTRNSLSGGLLALTQFPEEKRRLIENPALIPLAAKEIVRWVSPVLHMRRTATADTEIRGTKIKRGDKIIMWYCSANRDEDAWSDAGRFDVGREGIDHLGFGTGQHFCLGSRLAELQIKVALEELLTRMPDIAASGPTRKIRSNFLNGIKSMPVRFTAMAA